MFLSGHALSLCFLALVIIQIDSINAFTHLRVKEKHRPPTLKLDNYPNYDEIMKYLDTVAEAYGNRVTLNEAGKSYENRILKTITITNGDGRTGKNVIFMDAAMHSREWITPISALYVVDQLLGESEHNAHLLKDYDWIIMPLVNPDGYEYSRTEDNWWRNTRSPNGNNCFGTNLNRNFDVHWKEGYPELSDPCAEHYAGSKPFSESEAVAVRDIMLDLVGSRRGKMYLSLHSHNESIFYPWVYESVEAKNHQELHEIAEHGANAIRDVYLTNFKPRPGHKYGTIGGTSLDYAYSIGIPLPYVLELSGRNYGFYPPPEQIRLLAQESWVGIRAMAEMVVEKYPLQDEFNQHQRSAASTSFSTINIILIPILGLSVVL